MGGVLFLRWRKQAPLGQAAKTGEGTPPTEWALMEPQQSMAALWRRAEDLAGKGDYLEAVRFLYLAMLGLLHRSNLIRYERTQTNGEYLQQLRQSAAAPTTLQQPVSRLIRLFEEKWYGERECQPTDYQACRGLAEEIREVVRG
jgi:hypothetical protein